MAHPSAAAPCSAIGSQTRFREGNWPAEQTRVLDDRINLAKLADLPGDVQRLALRGQVACDDGHRWKALPERPVANSFSAASRPRPVVEPVMKTLVIAWFQNPWHRAQRAPPWSLPLNTGKWLASP